MDTWQEREKELREEIAARLDAERNAVNPAFWNQAMVHAAHIVRGER